MTYRVLCIIRLDEFELYEKYEEYIIFSNFKKRLVEIIKTVFKYFTKLFIFPMIHYSSNFLRYNE